MPVPCRRDCGKNAVLKVGLYLQNNVTSLGGVFFINKLFIFSVLKQVTLFARNAFSGLSKQKSTIPLQRQSYLIKVTLLQLVHQVVKIPLCWLMY